MEDQALSLFQLLGQVKSAIKDNLPSPWWVVAEISELKVNYSGHCYLELIEKDTEGESIKARARATIWASVFRMIQPYFETTTHTRLAAGMKVMVKVSAEFHELYGFSLNISDIEPSYTVGELARQKQETINRLIAEGVYEMNKALPFPDLPARIAVISSKTAAGFGDFMDQLMNNAFGYKFYVKLFTAVMQGDEAEQSIIAALDKIFLYEDLFDVVVLIRGGGSQSEMSCFNSYWLALHLCQFPLPVLTGIGHEQDESIADLVAHTRLKTPTAVAEFLLSKYQQADERINELSVSLYDLVTEKVGLEKERLTRFLLILKPATQKMLVDFSNDLRYRSINLSGSVKQLLFKYTEAISRKKVQLRTSLKELITAKKHGLAMMGERTGYLDPFRVLERGYSITYYKGKALKDAATVAEDAIVETRLAKGSITSKTIKTQP